jgi:hypothetical protein
MKHEDPDSRRVQGRSMQEPYNAVDLWLHKELKRRYDDALREPLPDELVALLERVEA